MLLGRYEFRCRFQSDAHLPVYKGSTFRGVFGHALKAVVCALKRQECATCLLKTQCLYTLVFETRLAISPPPGSNIPSAPHPFVIRPPLTTQTGFSAGDMFVFSLLLFGNVNQHLPYFIYAFDRVGQIGVGKNIRGRRGQFTLEQIFHKNSVIYSHEDQVIRIAKDPPKLDLSGPEPDADIKKRITIQLITPLRLKYKNRYISELPFHVLMRAVLRRVSALMTFYGDGEPPLDYSGMVQRAEAVQTIATTLCRHEWERYSRRQRQKMSMGGMMGTITYNGDLGEFMPLIKFCEKTHIGKQTAFGLGEMVVVG